MKIIKQFLSLIYSPFRYLTFSFHSDRVLITRLDAIGDYLLFRSFFGAIKTQSEWSRKKFYLLGNKAFKELAEKIDKDIFDNFIWVDCKRLMYDRKYRIWLIWRLKFKSFDVLINPIHSRVKVIDEIIAQSGAKFKIGSKGDSINFKNSIEKLESDRFYDLLLNVPDESIFEYYRNYTFTRNLINREPLTRFGIDKKLIHGKRESKKLTIILFPGAGAEFRRWAPRKFKELIIKLDQLLCSKVVFKIAGSREESILADEIRVGLNNNIDIEDLSGKTELSDLMHLIYSSDALVSNETSAIHFAACLNTPAICISNGNHFGRFNPYPAGLAAAIKTIYPDNDFYVTEKKKDLIEQTKYQSKYDINTISVEEVLDALVNILSSNSNVRVFN